MTRKTLTALLASALLALACHVPHNRPAQSAPLSSSPQLAALGQQQGTDSFADAQGAIDAARQLGLPPGNYRVDVERVWLSQREVSTIGAMFKYASGGVVAQGGSPAPAPGFTIGVVGKDGYAGVNAALARTKSADRSSMFLVTTAGSPASLRVGQNRYVAPVHLSGPGLHHVIVLPAQQFVGADLAVTVRPAGSGSVQVELTPSFTGIEPGGRGVLNVTELTSTVIVPLGARILVASADNSTDSVASTLFSRTTAQGSEQGVVILSVSGG